MTAAEMVRNFGILPADQPLPTGKVRSTMKTGTVVGQYIFTGLLCGFIGLGGLIPLCIGIFGDLKMENRIICIAFGVFGLCAVAFIASFLRHDNHWVELDGDRLRFKRLYTRATFERPVTDINDILTEVLMIKTVAARIVEKRQGRIRAFSFRFHDMPRGIKVFRPEMTNVPELVSAVIATMSKYGQVVPEVIDMEGTPMVRRIYWATPPNAAPHDKSPA